MPNQENPMTIKVDAELLLSLLGKRGERWAPCEDADNDNTMCLHAAIRRCQTTPGDAYVIQQVANHQEWGADWHEHPDTTWKAVRTRILAGIEATDDILTEVFGPQRREIVTLIRHAATLTDDQAEQLEVALTAQRDNAPGGPLDAMWDAARSAAWDAAHNADRALARYAAEEAAEQATEDFDEDYAWAYAQTSIQDAALALSVRDLINRHGFTQEHYNTLTGPWATAIGPIHPDDTTPEGRYG